MLPLRTNHTNLFWRRTPVHWRNVGADTKDRGTQGLLRKYNWETHEKETQRSTHGAVSTYVKKRQTATLLLPVVFLIFLYVCDLTRVQNAQADALATKDGIVKYRRNQLFARHSAHTGKDKPIHTHPDELISVRYLCGISRDTDADIWTWKRKITEVKLEGGNKGKARKKKVQAIYSKRTKTYTCVSPIPAFLRSWLRSRSRVTLSPSLSITIWEMSHRLWHNHKVPSRVYPPLRSTHLYTCTFSIRMWREVHVSPYLYTNECREDITTSTHRNECTCT